MEDYSHPQKVKESLISNEHVFLSLHTYILGEYCLLYCEYPYECNTMLYIFHNRILKRSVQFLPITRSLLPKLRKGGN